MEAVSQWVDEITVLHAQVAGLRDEVNGKLTLANNAKNAAAQSATEALGYRNSASGAANAASDFATNSEESAEEAAAIAVALAAQLAAIAGGPVVSIDGLTDIVTGLAMAADVYAKAAMDLLLAEKVDKDAIDIDGALAAKSDAKVPSQKAVRTLVDPLVPKVGDIRYSLRSSVAGWLPLDGSVYLKSAYPALVAAANIPDRSFRNPERLPNPTSAGASPNQPAWSPNGRFLAMGISGGTIAVYDWISGSPVKVSNPSTDGTVRWCAWSPNSRYLACGINGTPWINIFDYNTGSPVKLANPNSLPGGQPHVAWSPNGRYLICTCSVSPYLFVYDFNTGSPVKVANASPLPSLTPQASAWSPDSRYIAVAVSGAAGLEFYDMNSGVPIKIAGPTQPPSNILGLSWSPDGKYIICQSTQTPYLYMYSWAAGVAKLIANKLGVSRYFGSMDWSPDSRYLALMPGGAGGEVFIYDWLEGFPVRLDWEIGETQVNQQLCWSPDGRYLAVGLTQNPYLMIVDGHSWIKHDPAIEFMIPKIENGWIKAA